MTKKKKESRKNLFNNKDGTSLRDASRKFRCSHSHIHRTFMQVGIVCRKKTRSSEYTDEQITTVKSSRKASGGGVSLAVRKDLKARIIEDITWRTVEQVWVEIELVGQNLFFCVVYFPPDRINDSSLIGDHIKSVETICGFAAAVDEIIIIGDFNLPGLRWRSSTHGFLFADPAHSQITRIASDLLDSYSTATLRQINSVPNENIRILDLCFVSSTNQAPSLVLAPTPLVKVVRHHPPLLISYERTPLLDRQELPGGPAVPGQTHSRIAARKKNRPVVPSVLSVCLNSTAETKYWAYESASVVYPERLLQLQSDDQVEYSNKFELWLKCEIRDEMNNLLVEEEHNQRHATRSVFVNAIKTLPNIFNHLFIATVFFYTVWACWKNGFEKLFTWHVLLCVFGFHVLMAEAILVIFSGNTWSQALPHPQRRTLHWIMQVVSSGCIVIGIALEYYWRGIHNKAHFQHPHSILGLIALILLLVNMLGGSAALYAGELRKKIKPIYLKLSHQLLGLMCFIIGMASLVLGYEKRIFVMNSTTNVLIGLQTLTIAVIFLSILGALRTIATQLSVLFP
ncbi:uncharacterized protein LOC129773653 [Toxorhynchites rutilus septentrionalis]|uniref:uncharacterized protein LOC129773653 n=1 Tax=Toxorhynchites rutilus septentrionalis TaxID=329112 RepID=UPI00247A00C4|nr:uncharacterized protein LOC129773653 [Toxorhynchites rutilus septentrionalis]